MFTPRRTLLLLAGFVLFGVAYGIYSRVLGWLDGLPQLPAALLEHKSDGIAPPPKGLDVAHASETRAGVWSSAPETDYRLYHTQFEFQSGQSTIRHCGRASPAESQIQTRTAQPIQRAPSSSKPKPAHLRQPGEVAEITTVHADKAILEFDREINNGSDMRSANLVRVELVSDFGSAAEDPRRGMIYITNNQRSADPNRYVDRSHAGTGFLPRPESCGRNARRARPDCRTDAPVEIVDRQNLPRQIGTPSVTSRRARAKTSATRRRWPTFSPVAGRRRRRLLRSASGFTWNRTRRPVSRKRRRTPTRRFRAFAASSFWNRW